MKHAHILEVMQLLYDEGDIESCSLMQGFSLMS